MNREAPEFSKVFFEVYKQPYSLMPVILFYSPRREVCICLRHGSEDRYFTNIRLALNYAARRGWISDKIAADITEEAEQMIRYQDRLEDCREGELHRASMRSRRITTALSGDNPDADNLFQWLTLFPRRRDG